MKVCDKCGRNETVYGFVVGQSAYAKEKRHQQDVITHEYAELCNACFSAGVNAHKAWFSGPINYSLAPRQGLAWTIARRLAYGMFLGFVAVLVAGIIALKFHLITIGGLR